MKIALPLDIAKGELENEAREIERLRGISERERSEMILAVCRTPATIHQGRIKSGLPPATPDPWPQSTWEFLHKHAPNAQLC